MIPLIMELPGGGTRPHAEDASARFCPCLPMPEQRTRTNKAFVLERSPARRGVEAGHPELQRAQDDTRGIVRCRRPPSVVVLACRWRMAEVRGRRNAA